MEREIFVSDSTGSPERRGFSPNMDWESYEELLRSVPDHVESAEAQKEPEEKKKRLSRNRKRSYR